MQRGGIGNDKYKQKTIKISGVLLAITNILIINGLVIFIKEATTWITGSIYGANWKHAILIIVTFSIFSIIAVVFIKNLNLHKLEDDVVIALGNKLHKRRIILLCISAGLAAGAVTIGGIIGVVADFASKWLFYPQDIPIGIFTAFVGAPYFIDLLI